MSPTRYCQVVLIFVAGLFASSAANLLNHLLPVKGEMGLAAALSSPGDVLLAAALIAVICLYVRAARAG